MQKRANKDSLFRRKDLGATVPVRKSIFSKGYIRKTAFYLLESEAKRHGIHIHYQLRGQGGERLIAGIQWTSIITRVKQYTSSMVVISTDVHNVTQTEIMF